MNRRNFYWINFCLLLLFSACGYQSPTLISEFGRMPTATIPPGVQPEDMRTEIVESARAIGLQHSNGVSSGLFATYEEQFEDSFHSCHVASGEPFLGRGWLLSTAFEPRDFAVLCWVDYIQAPCNPDWDRVHYVQLESGEDIFFPITISGLKDGVHDVQFLAVRDPYLGIDADDLQERSETLTASPSRNLYVGTSGFPPRVESIAPATKTPLPVLDITFFISKKAEPIETQGVEIWLSETAQPKEFVEFYIHFNGQDDPNDTLMAVMAFVNYEQVPLYIDGTAHLPLYVQRKARTWQPVAVQLRVPDQVDVYEMLIIVRSYAHRQLEVEGRYIGNVSEYSSQRVRLKVQ